nr:hypothetical protein [Candidatus Sigynarchaeota archaeon]
MPRIPTTDLILPLCPDCGEPMHPNGQRLDYDWMPVVQLGFICPACDDCVYFQQPTYVMFA